MRNNIKVLILSNANSSHTLKWVRGLAERGINIILYSLSDVENIGAYAKHENVIIEHGGISPELFQKGEGAFTKILFLKTVPHIKKLISKYIPDIVHAHFATSYGIMGALSGFHPFIISVWGNDVFNFPNISFIHKKILQFNLNRADSILSTSHVMAKETSKYTSKPIIVTPFGVDLNVFQKSNAAKKNDEIVIGIVKSLEDKYGIKYLLEAFKLLVDKNKKLKLLVVGGGTKDIELRKLTKKLGIEKQTIFQGKVDHDDIAFYHNQMDIEVYPSIIDGESFGVSVVEACACENPVVVTNVGGFPEVVENGKTGFVIPPKNPQMLANAIENLLLNEELRKKIGKAGRDRVKILYNIDNNIDQMIDVYQSIITN
jgi:glycosyltransferase involved in cell wall biosynthesis